MSSKAAIRYAKAVLQQANDSNMAQAVLEDMRAIKATLLGSKELRVVLQSPVVREEEKRQSLLAIFSDTSENTKRLINVLVDNKRINLFTGVASSYINLYNEAQGVKVATVITAVPLSSDLETKVLAKVKELTESTSVSLVNEIDPAIIGGFILRVGDIQYNASIANQLENIKREFSKSL